MHRPARLLLALIAHSPVCITDCKRLWDCLSIADQQIRDADFALTLTDLVARGLATIDDMQRLCISGAGTAALEAEDASESWR